MNDKDTDKVWRSCLRMTMLCLIVLTLGASVGAVFLSCDVIETVVIQDGERKLQKRLPPLIAGPRVLLFALDGVGYYEMMQAIRSGQFSRGALLLGAEKADGVFEHGYAVPDAVSILPSTTMAAWSSVYTGEPPARTGVPGNEWFVREQMKFFAPGPVSVRDLDHFLKMLTDGLVGDAIQTPTMYEQVGLRSHVSLAPVYRGASLFTTLEADAFGAMMENFIKGVGDDEPATRELYATIDQESVVKLIAALKKYGIPQVQVVYFPGIDLFAHVAEHPLSMEVEYLHEVTDKAIGQILDVYEQAGALDDTYIIFVADHGHTPVLSDDRHSLGAEGDHEPPALIEKQGFRMRPFVINPPDAAEDYQATVAYQGAMAYVYLADRSTCPVAGERCDWRQPARLQEDVMPVVRAFYQVNETGQPIPELQGTLDLIFAREPRAPDVVAQPFQVFDGKKLVPIAEYLVRHPRPDLLYLEKRMQWLGAGPYGHRAGDIVLLARSGIERSIEDRFYFSGPYHSWHGSPTAQDSHIPLIVAHKNDSGEHLRSLVNKIVGSPPSQLDVTPLVQLLLRQKGRGSQSD